MGISSDYNNRILQLPCYICALYFDIMPDINNDLKNGILKLYENISRLKFEELSRLSPNITYYVRDPRTDTLVRLKHQEYTLKTYGRAEELCNHLLRSSITLDLFLKEMISEGFFHILFSIASVIPNEYIARYGIYNKDCIN